jgi:putative restriction endonuclease
MDGVQPLIMPNRFYIGITDGDWFRQLSGSNVDEVNFWKPGEGPGVATLPVGGLFLFKLHAPDSYIVGGAHFVQFIPKLPASLVWDAYGAKNGVRDLAELKKRVWTYRKSSADPDPQIGSTLLNAPFWFERDQWISPPATMKSNVQTGMYFDDQSVEGARVLSELRERMQGKIIEADRAKEIRGGYGEPYLAKARLGQGAFRLMVTQAYARRCAVTGERTLPVLQAAHIKPFSQSGENRVNNGLLLRSDLHILFDNGYLSVTPAHEVLVSDKIKEKFENGRDYYALRGQKLRFTPESQRDLPDPELLRWHNEELFVA